MKENSGIAHLLSSSALLSTEGSAIARPALWDVCYTEFLDKS